MIFWIRSVRASAKVFFITKPRLNTFAINKNVRFVHRTQTENESEISKLPGSARYRSRRMGFKETSYFRKVMENNPKYPDLTLSEDILKANGNSANKLVIHLRNAVSNKTSPNKEYEDFELKSELTDFEGDEYTMHDMIELFHFLPRYCELYSKPVESELRTLSDLIERKIKELKKTREDAGLLITLLNLMKDVYVPHGMVYDLVTYVYYKYKVLTTIQLVEYFYVLHYFRIFYGKESKFRFEMFVANAIPELNMDEVAVVSYAFFSSELSPGSIVAETVSRRVLEEFENLNDIQASTIFKFFQFSGRRRISHNLTKIFDKCVLILDKFNVMTAIHIICSGVSVNTEHKELLQRVWDKATKEFDQLRLKDVERLLLTSLYSNFPVTEDSDFVQLAVQKFTKGNSEIKYYPASFFSLVTYLIIHNIYFEDLIKYALSDEYIKTLREKYAKPIFHQALFIEGSVQLERPEYELTLMPKKIRRELSWKESSFGGQETSSAKCNAKILNALEEMYDKESVTYTRPLVHYTTQHPILCINSNNEPQKIGDKLKRSEDYTSIRAPKDGNLWIAFVLLRWQGCLKDRVTPNLVSEAKLRHFRLAGYIPVTGGRAPDFWPGGDINCETGVFGFDVPNLTVTVGRSWRLCRRGSKAHNFLVIPKTIEELKQVLSEAIKDKIQSLNN